MITGIEGEKFLAIFFLADVSSATSDEKKVIKLNSRMPKARRRRSAREMLSGPFAGLCVESESRYGKTNEAKSRCLTEINRIEEHITHSFVISATKDKDLVSEGGC